MSSFNWDQAHLHTVRLTGRPVSSLQGAQTVLFRELYSAPDVCLEAGTLLKGCSDMPVNEPVQLEIEASPSYLESSQRIYTLAQNLMVPEIDPNQIGLNLFQWFRREYRYKRFESHDLNVLMRESGFSGYLSGNTLTLFDPQLHLKKI